MATKVNVINDHNHPHCPNRISWSAIVVGALVGMGLSFLLDLFGVTIGLSAFSMTDQGVASLAIGGLLGLIISTIVSMFFGGYAAGYLGRLYAPKRNLGTIYGFTTWSVMIILSAVVTSHVGDYVNSYSTNVTKSSITVTATQPVAVKASHATHKEEQKIATVTPKDPTGGIAVGAFIVFALFFVSALSSCMGAHFGMRCRSDD